MSVCQKDTESKPLKTIRSYTQRSGRLTRAQRRAWNESWEEYGIRLGSSLIDFDQKFGNKAPAVFEIGFGMGDALLLSAEREPELNFVGVETYIAGVGHLLLEAQRSGIKNLKVINADAGVVLEKHIADASLQRVQIYFPDPWPKRRHHKRRLIQPEFIETVVSKLVIGGELHLATDWEHYAKHMMGVITDQPRLENMAGVGSFHPRPPERPLTKFEHRGQKLGHSVWDVIFKSVR